MSHALAAALNTADRILPSPPTDFCRLRSDDCGFDHGYQITEVASLCLMARFGRFRDGA